MVTVDAVVFSLSGEKTQVLLVNRGRDPYKGKWAVPGGFVEMDEELEDAIARELQEETGLTGVPLAAETRGAGKFQSRLPVLLPKDRTKYAPATTPRKPGGSI